MWILPKQLHTSAYVPDTEGLISDLNEQSQICGQSLLVRSKPSPARTWSLKWKRDSWTQHLSGRILKPSLGKTFVTAWTSSLGATPVSPSAQQESGKDQKTHATSGPISQMELFGCDPESASLKTSKDISAWGCPTLSKTWQEWVTERRLEYSARVKSAHLTNASGCSSWPTAAARDYKGCGNAVQRKDGKHRLDTLEAVARYGTTTTANWLTPATIQIQRRDMQKRINYRASIGRQYVPGSLEEQMQQHGLAALANPSTGGSRQELWQTPDVGSTAGGRSARGQSEPHRASLERQTTHWGTPRACEWKGGNMTTQAVIDREVAHNNLVGQVAATPNAGKLNPRWVETLMGLSIGWTMPSCTSPLTIAQTNSACSEMG
jgi:hypothetical protein